MEDPIQQAVTQAPEIVASVVQDAAANLAATAATTNSTTKFIPTPQGMACAYLSIMAMALIPILVGSFKSIKHQTETRAKCLETGEQADTMTDKDAAMFPLIASCALFGFYILIKINPDLVNLVLSGYFFLLGVCAIYRLITPYTQRIFPTKYNLTQYALLFGSKRLDQVDKNESTDEATRSGTTSPTESNDSTDSEFTPSEIIFIAKFIPSDILAFILSGILGVWYVLTKHWLANNAFGLAFALNGIELLPINTLKVGCILLGGLFFYDVFWVFGTDVMVSVARKFDAPIKLLFPQDFLVSGFWGKNFAMLGLGDIVIPGIFIAFLLRFDHSLNRKKNTYFWSCFVAYILGFAVTIGVMTVFKHAQPALLYLVPSCVLIPVIVSIINGDFKALLKYRDHPLPPPVEDNESHSETDEEDGDGDSGDKDKTTRSIKTRSSSKKNK